MSNIHAEILKEVRKDRDGNIRDGFGICSQVNKVRNKFFPHNDREFKQILNWIGESLAPFSFYTGWLSYQNFQYNSTEVYKGRYAWLDWMIENHHVFDKVKVSR